MPRPRIPDRRERLLDAAEALVLERGFDAVSISAIATAAGISKGAVYLEFASKHDILDALLRRGTERMATRARSALDDHPRLGTAYRVAVRVLLDDPLMTAAFLDDRGVLGRHVGGVTDDRYLERHRTVISWLTDLQARGMIVSDVAPEDLALALSSTTIGLLSAAALLGPLSASQLEGAIEVAGRMAASFETP